MRDFNFFSTLENTKRSSKRKKNAFILLLTAVVVIVVASYVITEIMASSLTSEIYSKQEYLNSGERATQKNEILDKKQKIAIMNQYLSIVEASEAKVGNTYTLTSSFIDSIDATIPAGVTYTKVAYTASTFTAQCTADSKALVADVYRKFYDLGAFDNVYISTISKISDAPLKFSFSLQCDIKGGTAK